MNFMQRYMSSSIKPLQFLTFETEARFNLVFFVDGCSLDRLFRLFLAMTGVDGSSLMVLLALFDFPFGVLLFGVFTLGVLG